jgi:PAS domain S-box-containing protein
MARARSTPPPGPADPRSDERFRLLVESVQDYAIFMLDPAGHIVTWNAGAERLKGYRADEVIGSSFERFYPDEAIRDGWPREELRRASEFGRVEDEGWRLRKDGTRFWASVVITALRSPDGELRGFAKVTRDLTARRAQEDALKRSEEQLRLMIESVKDYAIFMLDPGGQVLSWNSGAAAIKGYAAHEVLGRHFSLFFTTADIDSDRPQIELDTALRDGRFETQGWRVRRDGTVFWANVTITSVRDEQGVLRGFAKVTRDLTEQRRLSELETSSRRLNEFLAMLAHELRNPLAPIRNAVSVMKAHPRMPDDLGRMREVIDRQLGHLTRLVDDLLDVARISTGKMMLRYEALDYRAVIHNGLETIRPLALARRQTLHATLPEQPIPTRGDPVRLAQAVQNVLHNAVKFTPPGGRIDVEVRLQGSGCLTVVTDSGVGIDPESLKRIFDLFVQANPPAGGETGLGIGLSLARSLIEQHGGLLTAESAGKDQGSRFTILLPLNEPVAHPGPIVHSLPAEGAPVRVLVIDDNRDSADTMVDVLQLLGHGARAMYGAREAISEGPAYRPELVLLDLNMPDGDGYSVMQEFAARLQPPPFMAAMTGYGQDSDRRSTLAAGFHAHLTKPVGADDLQRVLDATLQRRDGVRATSANPAPSR